MSDGIEIFQVPNLLFRVPQNDQGGCLLIYDQLEPSEIPANLQGQFSLSGQIFLHWAAATLKWLGEFQNEKF